MALVTPYPEKYMLRFLKSIKNEKTLEQWSVQSAILKLRKKANKNNNLFNRVEVFRCYLKRLPFQRIPLRLFNLEYSNYRHNELRMNLSGIYKEIGTNAAISYLRSRELTEDKMTYKEWLEK